MSAIPIRKSADQYFRPCNQTVMIIGDAVQTRKVIICCYLDNNRNEPRLSIDYIS